YTRVLSGYCLVDCLTRKRLGRICGAFGHVIDLGLRDEALSRGERIDAGFHEGRAAGAEEIPKHKTIAFRIFTPRSKSFSVRPQRHPHSRSRSHDLLAQSMREPRQ